MKEIIISIKDIQTKLNNAILNNDINISKDLLLQLAILNDKLEEIEL